MPTVVNVISMALAQLPGKEKLLILKTKAHGFRTTNISHSPNFYYWANKSFELISKKVPVSMYLSLLLSLTPL